MLSAPRRTQNTVVLASQTWLEQSHADLCRRPCRVRPRQFAVDTAQNQSRDTGRDVPTRPFERVVMKGYYGGWRLWNWKVEACLSRLSCIMRRPVIDPGFTPRHKNRNHQQQSIDLFVDVFCRLDRSWMPKISPVIFSRNVSSFLSMTRPGIFGILQTYRALLVRYKLSRAFLVLSHFEKQRLNC